MKLSFRWFGPEDPVPLAYIAQIPAMHSVVTAVYDVPPGQLWPMARLEQLRAQCQAHGLVRPGCRRAAGDVLREYPPLRRCGRPVHYL